MSAITTPTTQARSTARRSRRRRWTSSTSATTRPRGCGSSSTRSSRRTGRSCSARSRSTASSSCCCRAPTSALFFDPSMTEVDLRRASHQPARRRDDARRTRVDAAHLVRRARRPVRPPDPPLGGAAVRRRDGRAHVPHVLHRRVPQARARPTGSSASCCSSSARSRASPATRCPTTCSPAPACASRLGITLSVPVIGTWTAVGAVRQRVPRAPISSRGSTSSTCFCCRASCSR